MEIAAIQARINSLSGSSAIPLAGKGIGLAQPAFDPGAAARFQSLISQALARSSGHYDEGAFSTPLAPATLEPLINSSAATYGVDPALIKAVIANESGFNPLATSPTGAQGLMQLMPATAASLGVQNAYDPVENVKAGTRYLRGLFDRFGDWKLAVAAYNAGPEAVRHYGGIPPYQETQKYVSAVFQSLPNYVAL